MGVIINNQNTKILGFALKSRPIVPSASKKFETIEVEGRNGALTRFVSYEDLKFKLTFNILFQNDIKQKLREIKGLMANAKTLSFDDAPNFFYKVKQAHLSDTESIIKSSGIFSVEFVAEPFEYEASSVLEAVYPNLNLVTNTKTQSYTSTGTATNVSPSFYLVSGNKSDIENKQVTITYDYLITNSVGTWSGTIRPTYGMGGTNQSVSNTNLSGTHKETVTLGGVGPTSYAITVTGLPAGTTVTINNLKVEFGKLSTPWMPSVSEEYINTAKLLIRNNTTYYSQPIIKIYGSGNIKLSVNNEIIEIKNLMDCIVLDSELQEAYLDNTNKNDLITGDFPKFEIGENTIQIESGKVDKMQILPQWRWLT